MIIDEAEPNNMNVVHPCAVDLDVHKTSAAASVQVWKGGGEGGETATRMFPATHPGFREMAVWLSDRKVTAETETTGIYWKKPLDALEAAGIKVMVLNAQHIKQVRGRKTDVADSVWLARPSLVLPKRFRELRASSRHRRQVTEDRAPACGRRALRHLRLERAALRDLLDQYDRAEREGGGA